MLATGGMPTQFNAVAYRWLAEQDRAAAIQSVRQKIEHSPQQNGLRRLLRKLLPQPGDRLRQPRTQLKRPSGPIALLIEPW